MAKRFMTNKFEIPDEVREKLEELKEGIAHCAHVATEFYNSRSGRMAFFRRRNRLQRLDQRDGKTSLIPWATARWNLLMYPSP